MKFGPWSFASNLLVLKQSELDISEHCYDYTRCSFWVHIGGIPLGWILEGVFNDLAKKVGKVLEIQVTLRETDHKKVEE